MSIGDKLKELRNAHGYTLSELADKINIDRAVLNKIELGSRPLKDNETLKPLYIKDLQRFNARLTHDLRTQTHAIQTYFKYVLRIHTKHKANKKATPKGGLEVLCNLTWTKPYLKHDI